MKELVKKHLNKVGPAALVFGLLLPSMPALSAKCDWTVTGRLQVDYESPVDDMDALGGAIQGLEGVQVLIKGRAKVAGVWGSWYPWRVIRTDSSGDFSATKRRNCAERQFKVEVKFEDDLLELRHARATQSTNNKVKWYEVANDKNQGIRRRNGGTTNFGNLLFAAGGNGVLGHLEPRRHAQMWNVFHALFDKLDSYGPEFQFRRKLKVKYPHNGVTPDNVERAYANPITKVVYIARNSNIDDFRMSTLLHEVMHIWDYQRIRGENCLTLDLVMTGDTHDLAANSCPAFHEGFAEAASEALMHEMFGTPMPRPYSRSGFVSGIGGVSLPTVSMVERLDEGWSSIFRTMMAEDLFRWEFSGSGSRAVQVSSPGTITNMSCDSRDLGLKQLLKVFLKNPDAGYPRYMRSSDLNVESFFDRAVSILQRMERDRADAIVNAQDPEANGEPADFLCEESQAVFRRVSTRIQ